VRVATALVALWLECFAPFDGRLAANLLLAGGMLTLLAGGGERPVPCPVRRWIVYVSIAAVAALPLIRVLWHPWIADDYCLLEHYGTFEKAWNAMAGRSDFEMWYRPVYWILWPVYNQWFSDTPAVAYGVSIAAFATQACLLFPAARRCGAPRGVAWLAALLFAAAPAAQDTAAWVTNQCSLLSGIFIFLAIIHVPRRTRSATGWWRSCVFLALAFWSKEEAALGALLCVAASTRLRWRGVVRNALAAWPAFAALAIAAAIRGLLLHGMGGYANAATGKSLLFERALEAPWIALNSEFPVRYFLPFRFRDDIPWLALVGDLAPFALLVAGGFSGAARRGTLLGAVFVICALAPVSSMLPIGPRLESSRWLHAPSIGFSILAASWIPGAIPGKFGPWFAGACYLCLSLAIGQINFRARDAAADLTKAGISLLAPRIREFDRDASLWILGLPEEPMGAQCFNCGAADALWRATRRPDLRLNFSAEQESQFHALVFVDLGTGSVEDGFRRSPPIAPHAQNPSLDRIAGPGWRNFNIKIVHLPAGALVRATDREGLTFSPIMAIEGARRLRIHSDARIRPIGSNESRRARIDVSIQYSDRIARARASDGDTLDVGPGATAFRLNFSIPIGYELAVHSLSVEPIGQ
jgi:hypothetical protein